MFPNERSGMVRNLTSLWFMKIYSSTGLQACSWLSQWRWPFRTADPRGVEGLGGFYSFVPNHSQFWMYATLLGWEQFLRRLVVLEESVSNILPRRLRSLFYASQFSMKLATPAVVHFMLPPLLRNFSCNGELSGLNRFILQVSNSKASNKPMLALTLYLWLLTLLLARKKQTPLWHVRSSTPQPIDGPRKGWGSDTLPKRGCGKRGELSILWRGQRLNKHLWIFYGNTKRFNGSNKFRMAQLHM